MNRRILMLGAIAFTVMTAGLILVLTAKVDAGSSEASGHPAVLLALIPVYAALIPIFIARRRRGLCVTEKNNG